MSLIVLGSLDELISGTDDDLQLGEVIADPGIDIENSVVDGIIEDRKRTELWQIVKANVTQEQNTVITARYRKSMTLDAIGKELGVTRQAIRQHEVNALRKLQLPRIKRELEEKFEVNYARVYRGSFR